MSKRIPPDPEDMNAERALAGERVLLAFAQDFGETDDMNELGVYAAQNFVDLLADLAHYCDRHDLKMEHCWNLASQHYAEETDDKGEQFASHLPRSEEGRFDVACLSPGLRLYIEHLRSELAFRRWESEDLVLPHKRPVRL